VTETTAGGPSTPGQGSGRRRRLSAGGLTLAGVLLATGAALTVVAARGPAPPTTMPERVRAVASTLRCPVCQDLSVADSPARLAQEIRDEIARRLAAGQTPDQIRLAYVSRYGDWVLLAPPRHGINLVAWIAPILLLGGGLVVAGVTVRRWTLGRSAATGQPSAGDPLSAEDRRLLEGALESAGEGPA
jgi:cytochrome c-type biogenesis protein CcmH